MSRLPWPVRSLADTHAAQHLISTTRAARAVTAPARFAMDSLRRGRGARGYHLKSGSRVLVRPGTRDAAILAEVFAKGTYQPPWELRVGRALDVGGNIGLFGLYALERWPGVHVTSYEPDPANAEIITDVASDHAAWAIVEAAVSNHAGWMRFLAGRHSESREALDDEPGGVGVPVVDLFAQPAADLVKIDIEGAEWPILTDPRLATLPARTVVLEWHALTCPERDAGGYAKRLLARAGYADQVEPAHRFACNGVIWARRH